MNTTDIGTTPAERQRWYGDSRAYGEGEPPRRPTSAECPRCGQRVALHLDGTFRRHALNPDRGAGSRKCARSGKPAPSDTPA